MREQVLNDVVARQFLLGQLSPEEQGRIEELAFEDRDTFEFIESVENDLIDDFIQGDLSADEAKLFETHFLSLPGRRKNLKVSQMLQLHFSEAEVVAHQKKFSLPGWFTHENVWLRRIATAVAALALIIFAVWIINRARSARQSTPIQAGPDRPAANPSPDLKVSPSLESTQTPAYVENKPKSVTPEKPKKTAAFAVLLPSSSPRGGDGVQQLPFAHNTSTMPIDLALITQRNFPMYEVTLENEAGTVLHHWSNLKSEQLTSGKALRVEVPVSLLKRQEFYRFVVSGVSTKTEVIARYPFEIKE